MFLLMIMNIPTSDIPKNPAVRREWIKFQLRLRGISLRQLGFKAGVTQTAVSYALIAPQSHLETIIADALGFTPVQLFPERFDAKGNRLSQTRPQQRSTTNRAANVKNTKAA